MIKKECQTSEKVINSRITGEKPKTSYTRKFFFFFNKKKMGKKRTRDKKMRENERNITIRINLQT